MSADYDLERRFQQLVAMLNTRLPLRPVAIDPELAEPHSFLKILKARHMNWQAPLPVDWPQADRACEPELPVQG